MLKFGLVSEVDVKNGTARVKFTDDGFVSAPLKMAVSRSGKDKVSFAFNINEHVCCIMDEGLEYGVILCAVYDENNLPHADAEDNTLSINFGDNSSILYNRNSHTLKVNIKGPVKIDCYEAEVKSTGNIKAECVNAEIKATTKVDIESITVNIKAVNTNVDGILNVSGAATVAGVLAMGGMAGIGGAPIPGSTAELNVAKVTATDDITAAGKSLKLHTHTSAAAGSPTTPPI